MKPPPASIGWSNLRESTRQSGLAPGRKLNGITSCRALIYWGNRTVLTTPSRSCRFCNAKPKRRSIATS